MGESRSKAVERQTATLPEAVGFGKGGPSATGRSATRLSRPRRTRSTIRKLRKPRLPQPAYRKLIVHANQFAGIATAYSTRTSETISGPSGKNCFLWWRDSSRWRPVAPAIR